LVSGFQHLVKVKSIQDCACPVLRGPGPETAYRKRELCASSRHDGHSSTFQSEDASQSTTAACAVQTARHFVEHSIGGEAFLWSGGNCPARLAWVTIVRRVCRGNRFDGMRSRSGRYDHDHFLSSRRLTADGDQGESPRHPPSLACWVIYLVRRAWALGVCYTRAYTVSDRFCLKSISNGSCKFWVPLARD
jgi:hypothetical protein